MQTQPKPARRPSLIERAAEAYRLAEQINARVEREELQLGYSEILPSAPRPRPGQIAHVDLVDLTEAGFLTPDAVPSPLSEQDYWSGSLGLTWDL